MSHQTGIVASEELRHFFAKVKEGGGKHRLVKVSIASEKLVLDGSEKTKSSWDKDYNTMVLSLLERAQPCYIMYRLDTKNENGYQWLFLAYSPDESPVREKMLYAATRATIKMEFGLVHIKDEMFGTSKLEMSLEAYQKHLNIRAAPGPMTEAEEELARLRIDEMQHHAVDTKAQSLQGVAFPISRVALDRLVELKERRISYVQLSIDIAKETIELEDACSITVEQLPAKVPSDHARYHLFNFPHTHEGDYLESIVFIYSMPGYTCSIRERMLYSSCKGPLLDTIEHYVQLPIARKVEIDTGSELTEQFLYDEVHPKQHVHKMKFAKPKGPDNRGQKRITKNLLKQQTSVEDSNKSSFNTLFHW